MKTIFRLSKMGFTLYIFLWIAGFGAFTIAHGWHLSAQTPAEQFYIDCLHWLLFISMAMYCFSVSTVVKNIKEKLKLQKKLTRLLEATLDVEVADHADTLELFSKYAEVAKKDRALLDVMKDNAAYWLNMWREQKVSTKKAEEDLQLYQHAASNANQVHHNKIFQKNSIIESQSNEIGLLKGFIKDLNKSLLKSSQRSDIIIMPDNKGGKDARNKKRP